MSQNALKINEDKTKFIIFRKRRIQLNEVNLIIGNNLIPCEESIKILGVTLDCELNMEKHVTSTCRAAYIHIRRINSIRGFLTEHATKILMISIVLTRLDYCNSTYAGLPQKSLYKLHLAQHTAARVVARIPRHHHITPTLQHLKWLSINKRCQFKILVMIFEALHSQVPSYMCDLLHWYTPARTLRSASTTSLVPNRNKTVRYGKRLFDTSTAVLWNNLPNTIKCATSIIHYKNLLKQYMSEL